MGRLIQFQVRDGDVFLCCPDCPQAIHKLSDDEHLPWNVSLDLLKSRVADHAIKCHAGQIAEELYC
jgi:hypothetical protein